MKEIADTFWLYIGHFSNVMAFVGIVASLFTAYLWKIGALKILRRLGKGIIKRDIAVFAENGSYESLRDYLVDSRLFKLERVHQIHKDSIDKAKKYSVFLVHYIAYKNEIDKILLLKSDDTALIVYAPQNEGRINDDEIIKINDKRNSIVVNFRGRLINDILISLTTTSF